MKNKRMCSGIVMLSIAFFVLAGAAGNVSAAYPDGHVCSSDSECDSGNCLAGVCISIPSDQYDVCSGTRTTVGRSVTFSGIKFTAVSNTVGSNVENTLIMVVENTNDETKTVTYGKAYCRCQEHKGNPYNIGGDELGYCWYYWTPGQPLAGCQSIEETITLGAHEKRVISVSVIQYDEQFCGSYQLDFFIVKIDGVDVPGDLGSRLTGWSFTDLCQDCSTTTTTTSSTTTTIPTAPEFGSSGLNALALLMTLPAFAYFMVRNRKK